MKTKHMTKGFKALSIVQSWWNTVTAVFDATQPITVAVSFKHAKMGVPCHVELCSNSLACRGIVGEEKRVAGKIVENALTTKTVTYLRFGNIALRYVNPKSLQKQIVSKDTDDSFKNSTYVLKPPTYSNQLGPRRAPQPNRDRSIDLKTGKPYASKRRRQEIRRPQHLESYIKALHAVAGQ